MPDHVFVLNESNYRVCIHRGIVGLPEAAHDSKNRLATNDALLSRMAIVREGDYILFYITGEKELHGVWKAVGEPFYDDIRVWDNEDKLYPFRFRIESTEFCFDKPLRLNDVYDLINSGKIWSWSLSRASGTNAMFSISNFEFDTLLQEYIKINPFTINRKIIMEPYPVKSANLFEQVSRVNDGKLPRYEASLMSLLHKAFVDGDFQDIFGNYTDYLSYIPTTLGTEIDSLLFFSNPRDVRQITSYDIVEVKLDRFKRDSLQQIINYESWFTHKKVHGDINMVRVSAIAKRFDPDVIDYVQKRKVIEGKEIKLFQYDVSDNGKLTLKKIKV